MDARTNLAIPYRIEVDGGPVVRCWDPRDAPLLKDAVDSSLEHLRQWMPWAYDEPQEIDAEGSAAATVSRHCSISARTSSSGSSPPTRARCSAAAGCTRVRVRAGSRSATGCAPTARGVGSRPSVAAVLTRVGIELAGADRIEIRSRPTTSRAPRSPRRLGYPGGGSSAAPAPDLRRWGPRATRWSSRCSRRSSPARRQPAFGFAAFDCRGLPIA